MVDSIDLAYTLAERRTKFSYRTAVVASGGKELAAKLRDSGMSSSRTSKGGAPSKIAFVFTGQGSQWFGMGRELFGSHPAFASVSKGHRTDPEIGLGVLDLPPERVAT